MPTFAVPDDDMDSFMSDRDMQMEVDGDSFAEQIDGITRVKSDPNWQAQELQNTRRAEQQAAAQQESARIQSPPITHDPRASRPLSPRIRSPQLTRIHDQHMLDADVPSSIGKRKRSESQPPARDTYQPAPHAIEPHDAQNPPLRRIGGMIVTMLAFTTAVSTALATGVWTYITGLFTAGQAQNAQQLHHNEQQGVQQNTQQEQEQEILAVETDISGRKRRAVLSDSNIATPSESPRSQGQDSPPPPATETIITSFDAPGAFPGLALPTPEGTQSPVEEQPPEQPPTGHATTPKPKRKECKEQEELSPALTMPRLYEYNNPKVDSIEPSLAEMRARFPHKHHNKADWAVLREEKRRARALREEEEYAEWAERIDQLKKPEEIAFWEQEDKSEETVRLEAQQAAAREKFGDDWQENPEVEITKFGHAAHHTKGECAGNPKYYKMHEASGLQAHNTAKVWEAEVARDNEAWKKSRMDAKQHREFMQTSAFKKLNIRKIRAISPQAEKQQDKASPQEKQPDKEQPKPVAPAKKSSMKKKAAAATKEEPSRPTTSSSHKQASYKGGMAPSPKENAPGDNPNQAWSYDKMMAPGKSLLKTKKQHDLKDQKVDALVDRAKKVYVESPQEQRYKDYMKKRAQRDREMWEAADEDTKFKKHNAREYAALQRQEAEKVIEDARQQWEQMRLEDAARKDAAIEAVREEERARQAAEEAAKLKAEKEAEEARKVEEEKAAIHATKQILIRPLDPEWADRVQKMMDLRDKDAVIATSLDGTELRRHDFGSLLPQEGTSDDASGWLNDEIVNAFIAAVVTRKQEQAGYKRGANNVPPYEFFNSAWWTAYKKAGNITAIRRWSKRKGIQGPKLLKAEKIFFPVNPGGHWTLLIISPQEKNIEFVNSMSGKGTPHIKAAREWLAMELGDQYVADEWTETTGRGSRQTNQNDCGVFVAMNSLAAGKGYAFEDVTAGKMPEARKMVAAVLINGGLRGDWEL